MRSYMTQPGLKAILQAAKEVGQVLETPSVKLFKNDIAVSKTTAVGDLEEADFTGYAAFTPASMGEVHLDIINGNARVVGLLAQFHATRS